MVETSFQHYLYESREFADVTLVSDDYFSIDVHKTIFAYSSSFFNTLLHISTDQKPIIYLKGVHREELSAMVKLIYLGKASLEYDELLALSAVAEEYQIHHVYSNDHLKSKDIDKKPNQKLDFLTKSSVIETKPNTYTKSKKLNFLNFDSDYEDNFKKENDDLNLGNSYMFLDLTNNSIKNQNNSEPEESDDLGEVESLETNLEESCPINEVLPAQTTEDFESGSNESQIKMRRKKVEEEPSECNVCARKFTTLRSLQRHHKTIHELAQIETCSQCERVFKCKDSLRFHIRATHEPQTFMTCENCKQEVKTYKMNVHRKKCLKLICEFCKIRFDLVEEFNLHIKQQHINKFLA